VTDEDPGEVILRFLLIGSCRHLGGHINDGSGASGGIGLKKFQKFLRALVHERHQLMAPKE
jgi:hypothetical protein